MLLTLTPPSPPPPPHEPQVWQSRFADFQARPPSPMEPEQIAVVLARASDIHARLTDAIALLSRSPASADPEPRTPCFVGRDALPNGALDDAGEESTAVELRGLLAIRGALQALTDQLHALQTSQQQQRAERATGLAQIEERRLVLLERLKELRGSGLEIVQDALMFADETAADSPDLPLPPYPRLLDGDGEEASQLRHRLPGFFQSSSARMHFIEQDEREKDVDLETEAHGEDESEQDSPFTHVLNAVKDSGSLLLNALRNSGASAIDGIKNSQAVDVAVNKAKHAASVLGQYTVHINVKRCVAALIIAGAVAILSAGDIGRKNRKQRLTDRESEAQMNGSSHSHSHNAADSICPNANGGNTKLDLPEPVVGEHIECPFYQELTAPNVLDGRG